MENYLCYNKLITISQTGCTWQESVRLKGSIILCYKGRVEPSAINPTFHIDLMLVRETKPLEKIREQIGAKGSLTLRELNLLVSQFNKI